MDFHFFISHASEDKEEFVRPLALKLREVGLRVWYDEFSLHVGDSLSEKIDYGLSKSLYGIVILSKNFFEKKWPRRELTGLVSREIEEDQVILPIWHKITKTEIIQYSPTLADKISLQSSTNLDELVDILSFKVRNKEFYKAKALDNDGKIFRKNKIFDEVICKDDHPKLISYPEDLIKTFNNQESLFRARNSSKLTEDEIQKLSVSMLVDIIEYNNGEVLVLEAGYKLLTATNDFKTSTGFFVYPDLKKMDSYELFDDYIRSKLSKLTKDPTISSYQIAELEFMKDNIPVKELYMSHEYIARLRIYDITFQF